MFAVSGATGILVSGLLAHVLLLKWVDESRLWDSDGEAYPGRFSGFCLQGKDM